MPTLSATELLKKVEEAKYPPGQLEEIRSQTELLRAAQVLANIDVDEIARDVFDHLPEFRRQRASVIREKAAGIKDDQKQKKSLLEQSARLLDSAEKLASPDAAEQFKLRAFATEYTAVISSKIRNIHKSVTAIEPGVLDDFTASHNRIVRDLESQGVAKEDALSTANMRFLAYLAAAQSGGFGQEEGIRRFVKDVNKELNPESGHRNDVRLSNYMDSGQEVGAKEDDKSRPTPEGLKNRNDPLALMGREQREKSPDAEDLRDVQKKKDAEKSVADQIHKAALVTLNDREYAIFHTLLDNHHVLDFEIDQKTGKLAVHKKSGVEKGVTPVSIIREALPEIYSGDGAAYRAVNQTVDKLSRAILDNQQGIELTDVARTRRGMTPEQVKSAALDYKKASSKSAQKGTEIDAEW